MSETTKTIAIETVVEAVLAQFGEQMKASQIAKAATAVAAVLDVQKDGEAYVVKQQMTTNYLRNGAIDGVKRASAKGATASNGDVEAWLNKHFNKLVNGIVVGSSNGSSAEAIANTARELLGLKANMPVEVADDTDEDDDMDDEGKNA